METEEWRSIPGHGAYEVSSLGRVRRVRRGRGATLGRVLKAVEAGGQPGRRYLGLSLYEDNVRSPVYVHHLVASAFLRQAEPGEEINHIDGCKANNRPGNLEWNTHSQNAIHARDVLGIDMRRPETRPRGERAHTAKLTAAQVIEVRQRAARGDASEDLAAAFGVSYSTIRCVVRRLSWRHVA